MKIQLPFKSNSPPASGWIHPIQVINNRLYITLGASSITNFLTCPTYWVYSDVNRMRPQPLSILIEDHKTDRGTYGHSLLDCFYKAKARLRNSNDALLHTLAELPELREQSKLLVSTHVEIEKAFQQYCMTALVSGVDFEPLSEDSVEIGFSRIIYEDKNVVYTLQGRIDMLARFMNSFCVVDHKFQWSVNTLYQYNPQFRTYAMVTSAETLIANYIRVYAKSTTFERQIVGFTPTDHYRWKQYLIDNVFNKIRRYCSSIQPGIYPINTGLEDLEGNQNISACKGQYGHCQFHPICERLEPVGHPVREGIKSLYQIAPGHVSWE